MNNMLNNLLKKVIELQESPAFEFVPVPCNQRSVSFQSHVNDCKNYKFVRAEFVPVSCNYPLRKSKNDGAIRRNMLFMDPV